MIGTHWLSMIAGRKVGQRYAISKKQGTIGRDVSNAIQVFDAEVSRVHCRYQLVGDRLEIADLESANGTLVNGETIGHSVVGHGDQITDRIHRVRASYRRTGRHERLRQCLFDSRKVFSTRATKFDILFSNGYLSSATIAKMHRRPQRQPANLSGCPKSSTT